MFPYGYHTSNETDTDTKTHTYRKQNAEYMGYIQKLQES